MAKFNAKFGSLLSGRLAKLPALTIRNTQKSAGMAPPPGHSSLHHSAVRIEQPVDKESLMKGFAHLVQGMLHQADFLLSDAFTSDDRDKVRQLTGGDGIFLLSNRLNRLCGERARREIPSH
jgi:hypothetical protein